MERGRLCGWGEFGKVWTQTVHTTHTHSSTSVLQHSTEPFESVVNRLVYVFLFFILFFHLFSVFCLLSSNWIDLSVAFFIAFLFIFLFFYFFWLKNISSATFIDLFTFTYRAMEPSKHQFCVHNVYILYLGVCNVLVHVHVHVHVHGVFFSLLIFPIVLFHQILIFGLLSAIRMETRSVRSSRKLKKKKKKKNKRKNKNKKRKKNGIKRQNKNKNAERTKTEEKHTNLKTV